MNIRGRITALLALLVAGACLLSSATGQLAADDVWPPRLDPLWVTIAGVSLAIGTGRLLLDWGRYASSFSVAFAAITLACAGQLRTNRLYGGFVVAFVVAAVIAMRNGTERVGKPYRVQRRDLVATLAMVAIGSAVALAWVTALPPTYHALERILLHTFNRWDSTTGLTDRIDLESIDGMIQSDRVVLRVYGPAPESLRGIVYDRYESGRWRTAHPDNQRTVRVPTEPVRGPGLVTVRRVAGPIDRWFTPLAGTSFASSSGQLHIDPYGIARVQHGEDADVLWMRSSGAPSESVAPPGAEDLAMPLALREPLTTLVASWVPDRALSADTMARLVQHLYAGYGYALRSHRRAGVDPVIDFLFEHREGHCEYFASALALLGRAAGIPTRVVTGYRVAERSPIGGYYIVRERNAHAWVEAYIDGVGWRTYDATPIAEVPQNRFHSAAWSTALADGLAAAAVSIASFLAARTALEMVEGAALLALVYAVLRWSRARREAREAARQRGERTSEAMAEYLRLGEALAAIGVERRIGETLEQYAARVQAAPALRDDAERVAQAIRAYAAFRYGGEADEEPRISATLSTILAAIARLPKASDNVTSTA